MATCRLSSLPSCKVNGPFILTNNYPHNIEAGHPLVGFHVAHRLTLNSVSRFAHVSSIDDRRALTGLASAGQASVAGVTSEDITESSKTSGPHVSPVHTASSDSIEESNASQTPQKTAGFDVNDINFSVQKSKKNAYVSAPSVEAQSADLRQSNTSETSPNAVVEGPETTATAVPAPVVETVAGTAAETLVETVVEEVPGVKPKRIRGKKAKRHGEPQLDKSGRRRTKRAGRELAV